MTRTPDWPAPRPQSPVTGEVTVPGSKSLSNRYLVLAALATGPSRVSGLLNSRDTRLMASALEALGAAFVLNAGTADITPVPAHRQVSGVTAGGSARIDCGLAGTVMRFVPPLAAALGIPAEFDGDPAARERPMATVLTALRQLGCTIDSPSGGLPFALFPPVEDSGSSATAQRTVEIDASASSQFVSGLLLAGCALPGGLRLVHTGDSLPSRPHIDMTIAVLREVGVTVDEPEAGTWTVAAGRPAGFTAAVEPDLSNAATFLAAALVTGGSVTVQDWPVHTTQAGDAFRGIAESFGGSALRAANGLTITGPQRLTPVDLDLSAVGELTPVVAAVAACAPGISRLRGIGHLRGHETDRLAALAAELTGLGAQVAEAPDSLTITAPANRGGTWHTYADHRMVMAGAVLGLTVPGVLIEDPDTVGKTLPAFPRMWEKLAGTGE